MEEQAALIIQKNIRTWFCKKKYNQLLAEKIIKVSHFIFANTLLRRKMKNYTKKNGNESKKVSDK